MTELTLKMMTAAVCVLMGMTAGRYQAYRLSQRENMLEELISGMNLFRNEIYYTHDRLERVAARLVNSGNGCSRTLFSCFLDGLEAADGADTEQLWNSAVKKAFGKRSPLKEKDLMTLDSAGTRLGRDDTEGQCRYLEKTAAELELSLQEARSDREMRGRLYQTMGLAAGGAAAILVF